MKPARVDYTSPEVLRVDGKFFAQGSQRVRLQGVTYGPFAPGPDGDPFPVPEQVARDLDQMASAGVNALRTYHVPPQWLLEMMSDRPEMGLVVDIPWSKHVCFLESHRAQCEAYEAVRQAGRLGLRHPGIWGFSIGNEIPPDVVRWYGSRRIERFLATLADELRQASPASLVTYASYPPTEYLDLAFLDFVTFNVYLHEGETFRRYVMRLQNLVDARPLVLGELGMDTLRHGELEQAAFLQGHLADAALLGVAGAFVFSWTDQWHTGGCEIGDWAFGITDKDRQPKAGLYAVRSVFDSTISGLLAATPRVSVVVCSFNGGATLEECLRSLADLDYPNYEVVVVDDGSTDQTRTILQRHPWVRAIHQTNQGLSAARNASLKTAEGTIIAYTDSDCMVDRDWLTLLVAQLERTDAAAVGGPNLAPRDGAQAACVAAAPGQPTHVLESDQVAEHIPGCNMAFRREALEEINGFDPQFCKAGDDVDVCWRLQQSGRWITFAPSAFVWHHRRQTPRAYLKQQAGYGEAEALLRFKHPDRFNDRGHGLWRGVVYGSSLAGVVLRDAIIYRGAFGTGLFQCIYQAGPAHWAMIPTSLEWHLLAAGVGLLGVVSRVALCVAGLMLACSLLVAFLQSRQAKIETEHRSLRARVLVALLCYLQPLVRSYARYRTRYLAHRAPDFTRLEASPQRRTWFCQPAVSTYWSEGGVERTALLTRAIAYLARRRCGTTVDSGWFNWDLEIFSDPFALVRVRTVQEEHGQGKRLIRVQCRWQLTRLTRVLMGTGTAVSLLVASLYGLAAIPVVGTLACFAAVECRRASDLAARIVHAFNLTAAELDLFPCRAQTPTTVPSNDRNRVMQPAPSSESY